MKKELVSVLGIMCLIVIICFSCGKSKMKGDSGTNEGEFAISPETQSTTVGKTVSYQANVSYNTDEVEDVTESSEWISSDESIAKSEGNGKFTALEIGSVDITANHKNQSKKVSLDVERPEKLDEGDRYSTLVWGIENCLGYEADADYQLRNDTWYCHGDCNDAYLVITGDNLDVTLGIYKDRLYLVSNKDQDITFTTYAGSWKYESDPDTLINDQSKIVVNIKDRTNKKVNSESIKIRDYTKNSTGDTVGSQVDSVTIKNVKKWYAIDIESSFEGTVVGKGKTCSIATSKLSKLKRNGSTDDTKAGFKFLTSDVGGYTSTKID